MAMANPRVLVVEDNRMNMELACGILESRGLGVLRATSAAEALAILRIERPALILMDIELPGQDGLSLTRQLKSDPATRGIAIVALTAYAMRGDRERALQAGCSAYLAKPIEIREFVRTVFAHLPAPAEGAASAGDRCPGPAVGADVAGTDPGAPHGQ